MPSQIVTTALDGVAIELSPYSREGFRERFQVSGSFHEEQLNNYCFIESKMACSSELATLVAARPHKR